MSTPIYLDPSDVEVYTVDGVRQARIAWERPCAWDAVNALKISLKDNLRGWQVAREKHREKETDTWFKTAYPEYYKEKMNFLTHVAAGGTVSSFREKHDGKIPSMAA